MENGPAGDATSTDTATPGSNEHKRLRGYFAEKMKTGELMAKQQVLPYLLDLGALLRKQDIIASASTLVDVIYDKRGYQSAEEILELTQDDILDAQTDQPDILLTVDRPDFT